MSHIIPQSVASTADQAHVKEVYSTFLVEVVINKVNLTKSHDKGTNNVTSINVSYGIFMISELE